MSLSCSPHETHIDSCIMIRGREELTVFVTGKTSYAGSGWWGRGLYRGARVSTVITLHP